MNVKKDHEVNNALRGEGLDMFQLFSAIWQQKMVLVSSVILFVGAGLCYAFFSKDVYLSESRILPPELAGLTEIRATLANVKYYSPELMHGGTGTPMLMDGNVGTPMSMDVFANPAKALDVTNQYLISETLKEALVTDASLAKIFDTVFPNSSPNKKRVMLSRRMQWSLPDEKKGRVYTVVSIEWPDPDQGAQIVNRWVELAKKMAARELVGAAAAQVDLVLARIKSENNLKRAVELSQLDAELVRLSEAKNIAEKLNLLKPVDLATQNLVNDNKDYKNVMDLRALYLLGSEALSSEIEVLSARKQGVDKFISDLRLLELKKKRLMSMKFDEQLVETAKVDIKAGNNITKIGPNVFRIMVFSFLLGVISGGTLAIVLAAWRQSVYRHG